MSNLTNIVTVFEKGKKWSMKPVKASLHALRRRRKALHVPKARFMRRKPRFIKKQPRLDGLGTP